MCHRECAFSLTVDGKEVFSVEGKEGRRIQKVLGKDFFTPEIQVDYQGEGLSIKGVMAGPEKYRSNRLGQYLVVNKRNVYSLLVSNAVLAGFGSSLGKGDFPLFFLDMTFDPDKIDVNVHPQKKEVRFQEEEKVFAMVREAVSLAITGSYEVRRETISGPRSYPTAAFKDFNYVEEKDFSKLSEMPRPMQAYQPHFEEQGHITIKMLWDELCLIEVEAPHRSFPGIEDKERVLIDLSVLERANKVEGPVFVGQKLLAPEEIFLTAEEIGVCREYSSSFEDLGMEFDIRDVSVDVREMPVIKGMDVKDVFMYAITLLHRGEHVKDIKEKILFRVLHKKRYTQEEAIYLIEQSGRLNPGSVITKKDIKALCIEYKS